VWWDGGVAADGRDFVRLAEWRRVREFVMGTRAAPAGLAIQGEAGAGKSTLWRAGVEAAGEAGQRLLRSEPSASEADLSFAGLSDLLAGVLPGVVGQIPGPQREALEVALLLRAVGEQPPTARAVGLAVLAALRACTSEGPVLVAIDDIQWLDEASLDALTFALRRLASGPLSLLAAARTEAAADPLTACAPPPPHGWQDLLDALPAAEVIDLAPLDMWQIQNLLPRTVTAAQARLVARQSRGNPFWAMEILASLDAADATLPPLARALTSRLSRSLCTEAAEALAVVAAAGRIGMPEAVAALAHLDDPAGALDAAVLAGVVVVENGTRFSVAHPLIGAAAVESLPPGQRVRLYQRLAQASSGPERYAHFAALAAAPGPDAAVADALDAAAESAHARAGNAAAAQFAAQAVAFTPESDSDALVRRRIRAGELLLLAGDFEGSMRHLEVLDMNRLATPDLERALPPLLDTADLTRGTAAAAAIVADAVEAAGPDPRRRALVLALASDMMYGIRGRRRAAAIEAIGRAEEAGAAAEPSLHRALINLAAVKVTAGEGLDTDLLDRAASLEPRLPVLRIYDSADTYRAWSRYTEDLDLARAALGRCIARAADIGDDFAQWAFLGYVAVTEELAGDFTAATAALEAADKIAAWYDWPPSPWNLEARCELLIAAGDMDRALAIVNEFLPDEAVLPMAARFKRARIRGKVNVWRGDAAAVVQQLELAAGLAEQLDWADPGVRDRIDPPLAEAYVAVGRSGDAQRISAWLREIGERLSRPALVGDACRIDALVAADAGELDAAAESARAAVAAHGSSPLRVELALSLLALGRIERRRKARSQSRAALAQAMELAAEIGHRPLLAEIDRELPRVAAARSGTALTATERRVAELIAGGATNRDAAAALFVSVRTVETHVASIYRKLGVRTRAELGRRFLPAGQGPPAP
jgi:DNA-binding CsgD family transcriptional regulator